MNPRLFYIKLYQIIYDIIEINSIDFIVTSNQHSVILVANIGGTVMNIVPATITIN